MKDNGINICIIVLHYYTVEPKREKSAHHTRGLKLIYHIVCLIYRCDIIKK